ncbi:MAG: DUF1987 domain-containing protein [Bacteroidales bacterium]|jgi:hypothetical protein|nr:DUF1987 domain-containing protein [Bacteroidales bacterium]
MELEDIVIEGSHKNFFTPSVNFNAKTGICELSGESFLEDTAEFYKPLIDWLVEYTEKIKKPIAFIIKLTYFNTSTSRCILDLLNVLKDYEDEGGEVVVNWHYDENDSDMEEDIEDYMIDTGLKINIIPF